MNPEKPLPFWLVVGISCLAVAGVLGTISTRTVQADARLQGPIATASPVVATATPVTSVAAQPTPRKHGKIFRGIASWYGSVFNGRKTASGETYNMYDMTACHPTLPFGTRVRVIDLANHKSVVVRITDRGDLLNKRIIDLSYAAAQKLEMTKNGLARVKLEIISLGPSPERDRKEQPSRQ